MDARAVGSSCHGAAERIDLFGEVPLADAPDRGVTAHLAERLEILRQQQRAHAAARRSERGFGAGVTAADDDTAVARGIVHGRYKHSCDRF